MLQYGASFTYSINLTLDLCFQVSANQNMHIQHALMCTTINNQQLTI